MIKRLPAGSPSTYSKIGDRIAQTVNRQHAPALWSLLDVQRAAQHDRDLFELRPLTRLLPSGRQHHPRETSNQREFAPHVDVPEAQLPLASRGWFQSPRITMTYVLRTATDPVRLVDTLRLAVAEAYPRQPIYGIRTMEEVMSEQLASWRQYLMLLGAFAGIAAVLTLVGRLWPCRIRRW